MLAYRRLQSMIALVLAVSHLFVVYLDPQPKLKAISKSWLTVSQRIYGIPDFRFNPAAETIKEMPQRSDKGPWRNLGGNSRQIQFSRFSP